MSLGHPPGLRWTLLPVHSYLSNKKSPRGYSREDFYSFGQSNLVRFLCSFLPGIQIFQLFIRQFIDLHTHRV
jgi:hypothetical protein